MQFFALFDGTTVIGGPQYPDPGGWTEVDIDQVSPGTPTEWDFSGQRPRCKAKVFTPQEDAEIKSAQLRSMRNRLLAESDWTDTYSAPGRLGQTQYDAWQSYRQALRDVTLQAGFPENVSWPTIPTS